MPLDRVTQILQAFGFRPDLDCVRPTILAAAQARGEAIHRYIEGAVYGLDQDALPDEWRGYARAFDRFVHESGCKAIAAELEVTSQVWRYCGHPDLVAWVGSDRCVIDAKTGDATGGDLQVAGYALAWNEMWPEEQARAGAILHLRGDGTYRFEEVELPHAIPIWQAICLLRAEQERRR